MPRDKRIHKQQRFDLYPDNPDEARLHAFLTEKSKLSQQRTWIVTALLAALKAETPDARRDSSA